MQVHFLNVCRTFNISVSLSFFIEFSMRLRPEIATPRDLTEAWQNYHQSLSYAKN
jgi:hypothetical protein